MNESIYLECVCHDMRDTLRVTLFADNPCQLCFEVLVVPGGFWHRLKSALRFLFRRDSLSSAETFLAQPEVAKLHAAVHEYERLEYERLVKTS